MRVGVKNPTQCPFRATTEGEAPQYESCHLLPPETESTAVSDQPCWWRENLHFPILCPLVKHEPILIEIEDSNGGDSHG